MYDAGSMWDGKKSEETEKAKQRRLQLRECRWPVWVFTVCSCVVKK